MLHRGGLLHTLSNSQWNHLCTLKLTVAGILTSHKLADATKPGLFFPGGWSLHISHKCHSLPHSHNTCRKRDQPSKTSQKPNSGSGLGWGGGMLRAGAFISQRKFMRSKQGFLHALPFGGLCVRPQLHCRHCLASTSPTCLLLKIYYCIHF